jgi:hypothetical protein
VTELGSEDGRLPEQLQSEAHVGAHGTKAVLVALLANLGIAVAKWHSVGPCSLPSPPGAYKPRQASKPPPGPDRRPNTDTSAVPPADDAGTSARIRHSRVSSDP